MTKSTDIAITTTGIMGWKFGDPEQAMVCRPLTLNGGKFLNAHRKFMQPTLIGEGFPVLCIARRRVERFIACAAKGGVSAVEMSLKEYRGMAA